MGAKRNIGFVGLGDIGRPMAKHLVCDAFEVYVFDLVPAALDELVAAGATACGSIAELAKQCDCIGICVRDDAQVESILLGEDGLLANARSGATILVHSTVTQANLLQWAELAREAGLRLLDAPMTGGAGKAQEGTLCYMVGGEAADVESISPVLRRHRAQAVQQLYSVHGVRCPRGGGAPGGRLWSVTGCDTRSGARQRRRQLTDAPVRQQSQRAGPGLYG